MVNPAKATLTSARGRVPCCAAGGALIRERSLSNTIDAFRMKQLPRLALPWMVTACAACTPTTYLQSPSIPAEHTITVGGSASLDVLPDEACVELTIAAHDTSMLAAHSSLMSNNGALLAELRQRPGLVVEQGTLGYAPEYEGGRLTRYVASTQINVRMRDFAQIADVIGRAATRGLERVEVVYYSTQILAKKADVRTQALGAAREKAQAMAGALGVSLGDVITIQEGDSRTSSSTSTNNYLERGAVDRASNTPAPPGSIPLSSSVSVVYRLR